MAIEGELREKEEIVEGSLGGRKAKQSVGIMQKTKKS
jgi:hypothetical protein